MLNSWFSLFLTDNLTPKLIIVCMWKITDVYFLAQSARKKILTVITIGIIAKKTPQIIEIYEEKKLKAKLIYVRHSLICCHLKKKNRKKTLDIWEQFLWFTAPLGDSWWKKLYFTTYKLTKMMQMSDYVIKTNKNKPKLLYLSFFQFCMLLPKSSRHCSFQVTRHVQTCLPEIIRKSQNNNLPRQSKSLLEKTK